MNYLASPFGTKEYETVNFGVEGVHFTRGADGGIVKTELSKTENNTNVPVKYIAAAPSVLYYPGGGETAQRIYDWEKAALKNSVADPSNGLMSETWTSQSAAFSKPINDAIAGIVFGRIPLSDWDGLVKTFKSAGADKSADEFAKEKAAADKA
jgi:putative aldouronate transport system substrate-binding protein